MEQSTEQSAQNKAKRSEQVRTEEEKAKDIERRRAYQAKYRAALTEEYKAKEREKQRAKAATYRKQRSEQVRTEEEKAKEREKQRASQAKHRAAQSEEAKAKDREKQRAYYAKCKAARTDEEHAKALEWRKVRRTRQSEEKLERDREKQRASYRRRMNNLTEEQYQLELARSRKRTTKSRANRSEEKVQLDREKDREIHKERQAIRLEQQAEKQAEIYPIGMSLDLEMSLEPTPTTTTGSGLSIIVCARYSAKVPDEVYQGAIEGNDIVLRKFIDDFTAASPILATESVVWNGRKAWAPLPWAIADDNEQIQFPDGDFDNQGADTRFCTFLSSRPEFSHVIMLLRGIDGASIDPGSWSFLQQRFPKLQFTLAISCAEIFVRNRAPDGQMYFSRTAPYDQRLYGFFPLSRLVSHLIGMSADPKSDWLISEWKLGVLYRRALEMAYIGGEIDDISNAASQFEKLITRGRNNLPSIQGH
ncbi:uncharacterized protein BP5553_09337 [Venustampulla echinocandica]|uniref:Uncharacterized protein n=1 Tax=Venustampulla echinocandica TaxID=2656787 RepID=A0A370TCI1_9HELO|nr:uncharacterized protein BP5553_09337 [Venustampulla echinocandica]RDL31935.1 hypothetical protein BP5553_09337 [Venustampulla echinocandica]